MVPLGGAGQGTVRLRFGAGTLTTSRAAPGNLVDGLFEGGVVRRNRGFGGVELSQDTSFGVPWLDHRADWTVGLSAEVPLDLRVDTGAARALAGPGRPPRAARRAAHGRERDAGPPAACRRRDERPGADRCRLADDRGPRRRRGQDPEPDRPRVEPGRRDPVSAIGERLRVAGLRDRDEPGRHRPLGRRRQRPRRRRRLLMADGDPDADRRAPRGLARRPRRARALSLRPGPRRHGRVLRRLRLRAGGLGQHDRRRRQGQPAGLRRLRGAGDAPARREPGRQGPVRPRRRRSPRPRRPGR